MRRGDECDKKICLNGLQANLKEGDKKQQRALLAWELCSLKTLHHSYNQFCISSIAM
jgi:hypothetical protein